MSGFTKLFNRILDSTVWREDDRTRLLWITMLALADRDGVVQCTIPGLADRARIPLGECERALGRFQEPDKYSWSQEEEGRRIRVVNGGWELINYQKYREMMSEEDQREKARIRQQRKRERARDVTPRHALSRDVTLGNDIAEAEAKADTKAIKSNYLTPSAPKRACRIPEDFIPKEEHYALGKSLGINTDMEFQRFRDYFLGVSGAKGVKRDWDATLRNWLRNSLNYGKVPHDGHKTSSQLRNERNQALIDQVAVEMGFVEDGSGNVREGSHPRRN